MVAAEGATQRMPREEAAAEAGVEVRSGGLAARWGLNLKAPGAREGACGSILLPLTRRQRRAPRPRRRCPGDGEKWRASREAEQLVVVGIEDSWKSRLFCLSTVVRADEACSYQFFFINKFKFISLNKANLRRTFHPTVTSGQTEM